MKSSKFFLINSTLFAKKINLNFYRNLLQILIHKYFQKFFHQENYLKNTRFYLNSLKNNIKIKKMNLFSLVELELILKLLWLIFFSMLDKRIKLFTIMPTHFWFKNKLQIMFRQEICLNKQDKLNLTSSGKEK